MRSRNSLPELATLLRAPPESDALVILGRLLDSLPIGFHITDCAPSFHFVSIGAHGDWRSSWYASW